ncbi:MAG TPA: GntR family transcriptional regulator [Alphaproteobacteria bacterium]|nr:GntR family transcriptional regulator [Alphaproteobacteria bacterium]
MTTKRREKLFGGEYSPEGATLTDQAYQELEEQIVTLDIAPGTVVSEAQLSKRLGIGRTPTREALQRLARERLVVIMPRRGIVVSEINVQTQLQLIEVRRELERLLAQSAARRATEAQRARFAELAEAMKRCAESGDGDGFMKLDREFNQLALAAARNGFLASALALVHGLSRRFWFAFHREVGDLAATATLHATVARAIAEGDRERAAAASDRLMAHVEDFARRAVTQI